MNRNKENRNTGIRNKEISHTEPGNDLFVFRKFRIDHTDTEHYYKAAVDKLQTLFPGEPIVTYDSLTIGIHTHSLYSETGIDTYELGLVDDEIPAIRNTRDGNVITFSV